MIITQQGNDVTVSGLEYFSVSQTFDCGQCFRFDLEGDSATGYAFGKKVTFTQLSFDTIRISPCTVDEFESIWKSYLSLDIDDATLRFELCRTRAADEKLSVAMESGKGIRLLRQDMWETLCSFIISQNNNIPRIKKIISALCKAGAEITGTGQDVFPAPKTLIQMGQEGLFALKTGFRAAYLYDAACKVDSGEVDLDAIFKMPTEMAAEQLCRIKGVGPKVAACTLLFGFEKYDAFPIDVWVKRVMQEYYGGMVQATDFGRFAGLAQQYLFYHRRYVDKM